MSVAGYAVTEGENIMKKSTSSFFTGQRVAFTGSKSFPT